MTLRHTHLLDLSRRRHHRRLNSGQRRFERLELGVLGDVEHADDRSLRAAHVNRLRVWRVRRVKRYRTRPSDKDSENVVAWGNELTN